MKWNLCALSIRQPYAELILWGIKTPEVRSMSTTIVGCRSGRMTWMIELAEQVKLIELIRLRRRSRSRGFSGRR
jgi:hypothetical protein